MQVNIDIKGDILIESETDFERGYIRQFEGCNYSAFVKCGVTPRDVIGLKLRKTSGTGAEQTPNMAIMQCRLHCGVGASCDVLNSEFRCGAEPCRLALHNCQ